MYVYSYNLICSSNLPSEDVILPPTLKTPDSTIAWSPSKCFLGNVSAQSLGAKFNQHLCSSGENMTHGLTSRRFCCMPGLSGITTRNSYLPAGGVVMGGLEASVAILRAGLLTRAIVAGRICGMKLGRGIDK